MDSLRRLILAASVLAAQLLLSARQLGSNTGVRSELPVENELCRPIMVAFRAAELSEQRLSVSGQTLDEIRLASEVGLAPQRPEADFRPGRK